MTDLFGPRPLDLDLLAIKIQAQEIHATQELDRTPEGVGRDMTAAYIDKLKVIRLFLPALLIRDKGDEIFIQSYVNLKRQMADRIDELAGSETDETYIRNTGEIRAIVFLMMEINKMEIHLPWEETSVPEVVKQALPFADLVDKI
jgi:hypothetical protein